MHIAPSPRILSYSLPLRQKTKHPERLVANFLGCKAKIPQFIFINDAFFLDAQFVSKESILPLGNFFGPSRRVC